MNKRNRQEMRFDAVEFFKLLIVGTLFAAAAPLASYLHHVQGHHDNKSEACLKQNSN